MEASKWITRVFGKLRFDYNAQRNRLRCPSTERELESYDEIEPSVRHARVKSPTKSKPRRRTQS
jgi:hypothetical protein